MYIQLVPTDDTARVRVVNWLNRRLKEAEGDVDIIIKPFAQKEALARVAILKQAIEIGSVNTDKLAEDLANTHGCKFDVMLVDKIVGDIKRFLDVGLAQISHRSHVLAVPITDSPNQPV